jgi:hypothetical protein
MVCFFAGWFDEVDAMDWSILLCVHIDEKIIYQIPNSACYKGGCYIPKFEIKINIIENKKEVMRIYPNPTSGQLTINN